VQRLHRPSLSLLLLLHLLFLLLLLLLQWTQLMRQLLWVGQWSTRLRLPAWLWIGLGLGKEMQMGWH
jgi:hypothetical protein